MSRKFLSFYLAAGLSGCASEVPYVIRNPPSPNPAPSLVSEQFEAYKHRAVVWGGPILGITNHEKNTEIEVLAKTLDPSGEPDRGDGSMGRFLVHVDGFLDPAIYTAGRSLSVYGIADGVVRRAIGEKPYRYPSLRAVTLYLWPKESERIYYPGYYPTYFYPYVYYPYGGFRYGFGVGYGRRWR